MTIDHILEAEAASVLAIHESERAILSEIQSLSESTSNAASEVTKALVAVNAIKADLIKLKSDMIDANLDFLDRYRDILAPMQDRMAENAIGAARKMLATEIATNLRAALQNDPEFI